MRYFRSLFLRVKFKWSVQKIVCYKPSVVSSTQVVYMWERTQFLRINCMWIDTICNLMYNKCLFTPNYLQLFSVYLFIYLYYFIIYFFLSAKKLIECIKLLLKVILLTNRGKNQEFSNICEEKLFIISFVLFEAHR